MEVHMGQKSKTMFTGLHVYERGGLTISPIRGETTAILRFALCDHCEIETPVDGDDVCTYCFKPVATDCDEAVN